jgi:hypothetical protein
MKQNKKDIALTRYLLRVGGMLVDGPNLILKKDEDGPSCIEKCVSIVWAHESRVQLRSVHIYCDASGSDEEGYLKPIVRFASWERKKDVIELRPAWPQVVVELAELPSNSVELQTVVQTLQVVVGSIPFAPKGLATYRNFGELPEGSHDEVTIGLSSGWQYLERRLFVCEAPGLYEAVQQAETLLRKLGTIVDRNSWEEMYDQAPKDLVRDKSWRWNGRPEGA